jgi:two-component system chemotaxis sensor kinase CheA
MRRTGSRKDEIALLRRRMVQPVIDIFIEALASDRPRLRRAWTALRPLVAPAAAEPVAPCLRKHDAGARALAVELGKQVDLRFEVDDVDAAPDIIAVIDLAVLHLLRNALDHGVESPGARVAAGKNATARVVVRLTRVGGAFELTVSDDGRGIDLGGVRARAVVQGLIRADARPSPAELGALLFRPGFSTRTVPTDVSGRGVGLDAVGAAIDAAGGTITVESQPGRGATWTATVPAPPTRVAANAFRAPGRSTPLAVGTDWSVAVRAADGAIDPLVALGIPHRPVPGGDAIGLEFTRGARSIVLLAAAPPVVASAESVVATAGAPASIALIDGIEGLLLDPEALA